MRRSALVLFRVPFHTKKKKQKHLHPCARAHLVCRRRLKTACGFLGGFERRFLCDLDSIVLLHEIFRCSHEEEGNLAKSCILNRKAAPVPEFVLFTVILLF